MLAFCFVGSTHLICVCTIQWHEKKKEKKEIGAGLSELI